MLEIKNLSAVYGDGLVLQDVSLRLRPGEVVGLLGPNGAGKTTLIKTILGLVAVKAGIIKFEEHMLNARSSHQIARLGIGVVPQDNRVFAQLSVIENLAVGLKRFSMSDETFASMLDRFPVFRERLHQRAGTLSGGEQQLLAIARAHLMPAKLMLLDEPTEGLMPQFVAETERWIAELRERGTGVLWAEQRFDLVRRLCDRIYFLDRGRIQWEKTPSELSGGPAKFNINTRFDLK